MTREEAIAILKAFMENPLFNDAHKAAFNIAIHDIKQRHDWDINNLILINKENYEPQTFKWCTDCKEYDQEKHCCHRWSKVIRDTVEEMKQEQEPTVDLDELKRKILMEVDGGTGDRMLSYCDICDRISDSIDEYKAESEGKK